ncbi:hypothetical protein IQA54_17110, partial [Leptospira borgpetersenii serovar Ballum]|nr:hypothetical protein [Leptospira borgpetersenii serovar Ballum]
NRKAEIFHATSKTEIYTFSVGGSVRCVLELVLLLFIFIALQRGLTVLWENRQSAEVTRVTPR